MPHLDKEDSEKICCCADRHEPLVTIYNYKTGILISPPYGISKKLPSGEKTEMKNENRKTKNKNLLSFLTRH